MIKLNERVTHNGKTYSPNDVIEKDDISQEEAQRLVKLDVAFFVGEIPEEEEGEPEDISNVPEEEETIGNSEEIEEEEISEEEYQNLYKQLDDAFNAEPLQKMAKDHGIQWEGTKKENVIEAIILEDKVEDILSEKDE